MKKERKLMPVALSNFFGTLNDNAFKQATILALALTIGAGGEAQEMSLNATISSIFILPFIFFSFIAGWTGDRFSRKSVMRIAKAAEFPIMLIGMFALIFYKPDGSQLITGLLYSCIFLMALQSTFFVPARAGIMPQLFNEQEIKDANGNLELLNFAGIILGIAYGGVCAEYDFAKMLLPVFALVGYYLIRKTKDVQAEKPDLAFSMNPMKELADPMKTILRDKGLLVCAIGETVFYSVGIVLVFAVTSLGKFEFELSDLNRSLLLIPLTIGIGIGCFLAGRVNHTKMNRGLAVPGLLGMATFLCLLANCNSATEAGAYLLFAGVFGGLFVLPVKVYLQEQTPGAERGRILAAENIIVFLGMLISTQGVLWLGTQENGITSRSVIMLCASVIAVTCIVASFLLSNHFVRLMILGPVALIYRIRTKGLENIPHEGPLLLLPNHSTWIDGFILSAVVPRDVIFMIDREYYNKPLLKPFFEMLGFIPVHTGRKSVLESLELGKQALADGKALCLFPEGVLTRSGFLNEFKSGFLRVLQGNEDTKVVPVYMGGTWASTFSMRSGEGLSILNTEGLLPPQLSITLGKAVPHTTTPLELWSVVKDLEHQDYMERAHNGLPGHINFLKRARRKPFKSIFIDPEKGPINNLSLLIKVFVLSAKLKKAQKHSETYTGILLPNSVPTVSAALASYFADSIPVFLNPTVSKEGLEHAMHQCGMKSVLTSRIAIKKLKIELPDGIEAIYLEDLAKGITKGDLFKACIRALLPSRMISNSQAEDTATVLFSSGSTGTPKGVVLSHRNVSSNLNSLSDVCALTKADRVLGHMPLFHSFGFLSAFWLPICNGIPTVMQTNPLDAKAVGENMGKYHCSILFGTPTFLSTYTRRCTEDNFKNLRLAIVGAEKLPTSTAQAFREKFGIMPTEAYGATELSPGVALNAPIKIWQLGKKILREGSVGRPLPGIQVKTVNPDTMEDLPAGEMGLLLISSPGIMKGYLNDPDRTAEVMRENWYISGDMAKIEKDGSIQLTGRLSRFSKIAGEMVPHGAIEEAIHLALESESPEVAVVGLPDPSRGEKLIILHTELSLENDKLIEALRERGLPNLWIPKAQNFKKIDEIPLLGSGKVDLKAIKTLAEQSESA